MPKLFKKFLHSNIKLYLRYKALLLEKEKVDI